MHDFTKKMKNTVKKEKKTRSGNGRTPRHTTSIARGSQAADHEEEDDNSQQAFLKERAE